MRKWRNPMKKRALKIVAVIMVLIFVFPIMICYKDGGSIRYQAILYSITKYHSLNAANSFDTGIEIKLLGITIYENITSES